ncbi:helix-turn-helix domain-containing protein [Faecalibacterium hominis (ex Afrizal et al. 2022)]|uniref:helix-turn-helix domain-containing protein n=1 Tax=Faecalibacterium hominis (ex Afrizal et al. 2022) TaxID=2881265 RepID=UPI003C309983
MPHQKVGLHNGKILIACRTFVHIFTLRTNAKLSQEKLAEKLGVSHRHLGDLERGSSNGSVKILIDIAEYFHVSMDYLLLGRDPSRDQFQNELQAAIDHLEKIKGLL